MLGLFASRAGAAERDFVREFPVQDRLEIAVETYRGAIVVAEADLAAIRVSVHLEIGAETDAEAEKLLDGFVFETQHDGSRLQVRVAHPRQQAMRFVWDEKRQIEPTVRLTVPRRCDLDLRTRRGNITVGNVTGQLRARAEAGDLFFRTVGGTVVAATAVGDIVVSRCTGSVTAKTGQGLIRVGTVTGRCDLANRSGDVEAFGPKGDARIVTAGGTALVRIGSDHQGAVEVRTSGGRIVAEFDTAAHARIEASASFLAKVENQLPLHIESGRTGARRLVGTLGTGASRIVLRASGGDVRLLPGDTDFDTP